MATDANAPAAGDELRALMRRFPAGVAVVTVDADGERIGLTIGTLTPLSLTPPLVGFAVRRDAALHELLRAARTFGATLLASDQEAQAQHFARGVPPIALWANVDLRDTAGPPLLANALGWLAGRIAAEVSAGEDTFFVADVLSVEHGEPTKRPLVYVDQRYAAA